MINTQNAGSGWVPFCKQLLVTDVATNVTSCGSGFCSFGCLTRCEAWEAC